jgi:hypothetical protein
MPFPLLQLGAQQRLQISHMSEFLLHHLSGQFHKLRSQRRQTELTRVLPDRGLLQFERCMLIESPPPPAISATAGHSQRRLGPVITAQTADVRRLRRWPHLATVPVPQQHHGAHIQAADGRHQRIHLTLKQQATRPAGANILQQQAKFDDFIEEFNPQRPHEALGMRCPAELYTASLRSYNGIPEPHYPFHDRTVTVTGGGRLCLYRKKINRSTSLVGQAVGVKEVESGIWLVSFMEYDLGYIDPEEKTLQPLENPFGPKVSPMV